MRHRWNGPIEDQLPWRQVLRDDEFVLTGSQGLVLEDLDLGVMRVGPVAGRQWGDDGRIKEAEIKQGPGASSSYGQVRYHHLRNRLWRLGDPERKFYEGFFSLHWPAPDQNDLIRINGAPHSLNDYKSWVQGHLTIEPLDGIGILDMCPGWREKTPDAFKKYLEEA